MPDRCYHDSLGSLELADFPADLGATSQAPTICYDRLRDAIAHGCARAPFGAWGSSPRRRRAHYFPAVRRRLGLGRLRGVRPRRGRRRMTRWCAAASAGACERPDHPKSLESSRGPHPEAAASPKTESRFDRVNRWLRRPARYHGNDKARTGAGCVGSESWLHPGCPSLVAEVGAAAGALPWQLAIAWHCVRQGLRHRRYARNRSGENSPAGPAHWWPISCRTPSACRIAERRPADKSRTRLRLPRGRLRQGGSSVRVPERSAVGRAARVSGGERLDATRGQRPKGRTAQAGERVGVFLPKFKRGGRVQTSHPLVQQPGTLSKR